MGKILLIAADWRLRALVRAQLLEEGFSVRAWPSLGMALAHLLRGGERPQVVVAEVQGAAVQARRLSDLWELTGHAPLILCGGAWSRAALDGADLPPGARLLLRPFRVGDVVDLVRRVSSP